MRYYLIQKEILMEITPFEILIEWTLLLSPLDLINLSLACKYFQEQIGSNQYFWKLKYKQIPSSFETDDWKLACFRRGLVRQYKYDGTYREIPKIRALQVSSCSFGTLCVDTGRRLWEWTKDERPILKLSGEVIKIDAPFVMTKSGIFTYVVGYVREILRGSFRDFVAAGRTVYTVTNNKELFCPTGEICSIMEISGKVKGIFTSEYYDVATLEQGGVWHICRRNQGRLLLSAEYKVKEIGFTSQKVVILLEDGEYQILNMEGEILVKGNDAYSMSVYKERILIWNICGKVIYSEGISFDLPPIQQARFGPDGLDLIFLG